MLPGGSGAFPKGLGALPSGICALSGDTPLAGGMWPWDAGGTLPGGNGPLYAGE